MLRSLFGFAAVGSSLKSTPACSRLLRSFASSRNAKKMLPFDKGYMKADPMSCLVLPVMMPVYPQERTVLSITERSHIEALKYFVNGIAPMAKVQPFARIGLFYMPSMTSKVSKDHPPFVTTLPGEISDMNMDGDDGADYEAPPPGHVQSPSSHSWFPKNLKSIRNTIVKKLGIYHDARRFAKHNQRGGGGGSALEPKQPILTSWNDLAEVGVLARIINMDGVGPNPDNEFLLLEVEATERVSLASPRPDLTVPPVIKTAPHFLLPYDPKDQTILALTNMIRETARDMVINQGMTNSSVQELLDVFDASGNKSMDENLVAAESFLRKGVPGGAIQKAFAYSKMEDSFRKNDLERFCDVAARVSNNASGDELYKILAPQSIEERLRNVYQILLTEVKLLRTQIMIGDDLNKELRDTAQKHYLNQLLKQVKKKLGVESSGTDADVALFTQRLDKLTPPPEVTTVIKEEIRRYGGMDGHGLEVSMARSYIDWLTSIPWGSYTLALPDITTAQQILEHDHYGMYDVKRRALEYIAVNILRTKNELFVDKALPQIDDTKISDKPLEKALENSADKQPQPTPGSADALSTARDLGRVLCLVGPPGTGKTSIALSIAKALQRPCYRFSVGGLSDASEIKGHRRTYVGALPGKLVQAVKNTKVMNPVIIIDEIDKLTRGGTTGDPASALLEVLDPSQNYSFMDHYIDLPLDLSKALFICTANTLDTIPGPLLDRMETVPVSGYVEDEKMNIAKLHLVPKLVASNGLLSISKSVIIDDDVLRTIMRNWCRESGVRELHRTIEKIFRRIALDSVRDKNLQHEVFGQKDVMKFVEKDPEGSMILKDKNLLEAVLGPAKFMPEMPYGKLAPPGVVRGLAWTVFGGTTLFVESKKIPSALVDEKPSLADMQVTGQLGGVMLESSKIAWSYARTFLYNVGQPLTGVVHMHIPEGATPKDGPSAGITMCVSIISLGLNKSADQDLAMTGELTLTGRVLPVGGIREKIVAARQAGVSKVVIPKANRADVAQIPRSVLGDVKIIYAETFDDVYNVAFGESAPAARTPEPVGAPMSTPGPEKPIIKI